jgi:hypothetical protein
VPGAHHCRRLRGSGAGGQERRALGPPFGDELDENLAWLDPYFGGTCLRLGYARAVGDGMTARFNVAQVGVRFSPIEQCRFDELTEVPALSCGVPSANSKQP